jgi:imidazolonepropionase-like amidohydrolase
MPKLWLIFLLFFPLFAQPAEITVIPDVNLLDGSSASAKPHVTVVIDGTQIREIRTAPPKTSGGAHVLHFEGKTVMPGLISAHSHLGLVNGATSKPENFNEANIERQLKQYERYGVTTIMSLGANRDLIYQLRDQQKAGTLGGAAILTAGRGVGFPGGFPPLNVAPDQVYRPKDAAEARANVRDMASHHPDMVKVWVDDNLGKLPRPNFDIIAAVIDESHKQKLRIAAHVFYLADAKQLVKDGVDVLAHSVRDKPVDAEFIQLMKKHHTAYIPTLQLEEAFFIYADRPDWLQSPFFLSALQTQTRDMLLSPQFASKIQNDPATAQHRQFLATAEQNLLALFKAGVTIGFGTDSGATPARVAGFAEHRELQLMVEAGLSPADALRIATSGNASILKTPQIGSLKAGKQADLIVLDADPLSNVRNTEQILLVLHKGVAVKPDFNAKH